MRHVWEHRIAGSTLYIGLVGHADAVVRCKPSRDGRYMWQFRRTVSHADTIEEAKNYVEAGAEFFEIMRRNPYS